MNFEELVLKYGVLMGIRYNEPDKLVFLNAISKEFTDLGYEVKNLKKDYKRFSGINCYIGDVAKAKNIIIANYDTPKDSFDLDYKYLPFNYKLSERELNEKYRFKAVTIILGGASLMFLMTIFLNLNQSILRVLYFVITVLMTGLAYMFLRPIPNKVNANLNTSGVLAVLEIAKTKPKDTAYILTDRAFVDNLGDVMVQEALPKSLDSKNVIILKGIGRGENLVVSFKEQNESFAKKFLKKNRNVELFKLDLEGLNGNSIRYYEKAVMITVADTFNEQFEIDKVCNELDVIFDEDRFNEVIKLVLDVLKES